MTVLTPRTLKPLLGASYIIGAQFKKNQLLGVLMSVMIRAKEIAYEMKINLNFIRNNLM